MNRIKVIFSLFLFLFGFTFFLPLFRTESRDKTSLKVIKRTRLTMYPCSDCHIGEDVNRRRRRLTDEHSYIRLKHAEKDRWCLDCHDSIRRNYLKLANGQLVSFAKSYRLCGQCHGTLYRDWRAGVHGKRTGGWMGKKKYEHCINCHNPHSPKFKPLKPMPPPLRPGEIKLKKHSSFFKDAIK